MKLYWRLHEKINHAWAGFSLAVFGYATYRWYCARCHHIGEAGHMPHFTELASAFDPGEWHVLAEYPRHHRVDVGMCEPCTTELDVRFWRCINCPPKFYETMVEPHV